MSQNHVIDPAYFYDALAEFSFNYCAYVVGDRKIDDLGNVVNTYTKQIVRGSLQSKGSSINRSKQGNTQNWEYSFYCKSRYRLNIGDFIYYKDKLLIITDVNDYDEWGVRSCSLKMTQLNAHRDLAEFIKYKEGEKIV